MPAPRGKHVCRPKARRPSGLKRGKIKKIQSHDSPELIKKCLSCRVSEKYYTGEPNCPYMDGEYGE